MYNYKKLIAIFLAIILIISMVGCSTYESTEHYNFDRFKCVDEEYIQYPSGYSDSVCIVVDTETNVLYLWNSNSHQTYMTVLLDTDGTPLIWENYHD